MKKKFLLVAMLALLLCLVCGSALASGSCKHSMTSTVVEEPTCTEKGRIELVCSSCGYESSASIPATGHEKNPTKVVGIRATCDKDGHYNLFCSKCRGFVATNVETIPATGHVWQDKPFKTKASTCTTAGEERYMCKKCTEVHVVPLAKDSKNHSNIQLDIAVMPTCVKDGYYNLKCLDCNTIVEKNAQSFPATGHFWRDTPSKVIDPTCTEKGEIQYKCERCTEVHITKRAALGHNYAPSYTIPTCRNEGVWYKVCQVCEHTIVDETREKDPMKEHAWGELIVENAPTCTEKGSGYYLCQNVIDGKKCNTKKPVTLDAKGHHYLSSYTIPTCRNEGVWYKECDVCGDSYEDTTREKTPAKAHAWGELIVETAATCTEKGSGYYLCQNMINGEKCNTKKPVTLDMTDHDYVSTYTPPTCHNEGVWYKECQVCGNKVEDESKPRVPANEHLWNEYALYVDVLPTQTEEGKGHYKCSNVYGEDEVRCPSVKNVILPRLDQCEEHTWDFVPLSTYMKEGADCLTPESMYFQCTTCGTVAEMITVNPQFTVDGNWWEINNHTVKHSVIEATCSREGYTYTSCEKCGKSSKHDFTPKNPENHQYNREVIKATCTEDEHYLEICQCGASYTVEKPKGQKATGHKWSPWIQTKDGHDGTMETRYCSNFGCDATETNWLEPTASFHGYQLTGKREVLYNCQASYEEYTCIDDCGCGEKIYRPLYPEGHNWEIKTSSGYVTEPTHHNGTKIYMACTNEYCRVTKEITILPATQCAWEEYDRLEATCQEYGSIIYECSIDPNCTAMYIPIPPVACKYERNDEGKLACIWCGKVVSSDVHDHSDLAGFDVYKTVPTCTTPAIVTYKCRLCDYSVEMRTEDYDSHLYNKVLVEGKQPTCTEDGVYPIYSCAHCDATYGGKVIPAYGHSLVLRLKKDADDPLRAPKEWYCVMCGYTDGVAELH